MPVASDLQTVISRIGIDLAGGKTYGRGALGRLQRELQLIREEASEDEAAAIRDRMCFAELIQGLDHKVLDQRALIRRAQERHSGGNAAKLQAVG